MSDNIDYAELDKAVNEAMQAQPSHAAPAAARPAARRPVARPAARPQSRGRFMDFAPRGATMTRPATKPAQKPVARPVITRPMTRKIVQENPTTANIPQRSAIRPTSRVATVRRAPEITEEKVATPVAAPSAPRQSVAAKIQQKQQRVATAPKEQPKPKVTKKAPEAPDANSYSLGGRSPFLTDTKVEKRPLGTNIPETNAAAVRSTKNVYSQKNPSKAPVTKRKKHTVTEAPKSHSGWLWSLIVILVIAAGAGLGYLAYLIVFAN